MNSDHRWIAECSLLLKRALRRLDPEQGRVARANARRAVWAALKAVRRDVEKHFAPIARASKERARPMSKLTLRQAQARMSLRGWCRIPTTWAAYGRLAEARVPVRFLRLSQTELPYVRPWVAAVLFLDERASPSFLRRLKRSRLGQEATMAQARLKGWQP